MLIPCVQCGKREYTQESPLWFHCDKCLYEKKPKYRCCMCLEKYDPDKSMFINYCDKCGKMYRDKMVFINMINSRACPVCAMDMKYYLLPSDIGYYECACGWSEEVG